MKIVGIDNFDRDNVSDLLIAENVQNYWAERICKCLNDEFPGFDADRHFEVKPDDYKLFVFEP